MSQCHIRMHVADYQWFKSWHYVYCHFHHCHERDGRDSGIPRNVTTQGRGFQCLTPHGDVVTLKSSMKIIFSLQHAAFCVPVCRFSQCKRARFTSWEALTCRNIVLPLDVFCRQSVANGNVVVQVTPYSERFMTDVRLKTRFTTAVAISRVGSHCCCTTFVKSHAIMANEIE